MSAHERDYMGERHRERTMDHKPAKPDPAPEQTPVVGVAEFAPARLTPAAAERVGLAGAVAWATRPWAGDGLLTEDEITARWPESECFRRLWVGITAAAAGQLIAELRLAGWRIVPPEGAPGNAESAAKLKGGV